MGDKWNRPRRDVSAAVLHHWTCTARVCHQRRRLRRNNTHTHPRSVPSRVARGKVDADRCVCGHVARRVGQTCRIGMRVAPSNRATVGSPVRTRSGDGTRACTVFVASKPHWPDAAHVLKNRSWHDHLLVLPPCIYHECGLRERMRTRMRYIPGEPAVGSSRARLG